METLLTILCRVHGPVAGELIHKALINAENFASERTEVLADALEKTLAALCPAPCKNIDPAFWGTDDGQIVSAAEYYLYKDDLIHIKQAARLLFDVEEPTVTEINRLGRRISGGHLPVYHLPVSELKSRRKYSGGTTRGANKRMVRKSDVLRLKKGS